MPLLRRKSLYFPTHFLSALCYYIHYLITCVIFLAWKIQFQLVWCLNCSIHIWFFYPTSSFICGVLYLFWYIYLSSCKDWCLHFIRFSFTWCHCIFQLLSTSNPLTHIIFFTLWVSLTFTKMSLFFVSNSVMFASTRMKFDQKFES